MPHVHLGGGGSDRGLGGTHAGFRFSGALLRLPRGNLGAAQCRTGAYSIGARALLGQMHLDLCPTQVGGGHSHGSFHLLDADLKIARIELREELVSRDWLVVHDVHSQNCAVDLGAERHDIAGDIGIVRRFVRAIVLPELPAVRDTKPEQHYQETVENIPSAEQLAPLPACYLMHTGSGVSGTQRGDCYRGTTRRAVCPAGLMCHDANSIGRDTLSNTERTGLRERENTITEGRQEGV